MMPSSLRQDGNEFSTAGDDAGLAVPTHRAASVALVLGFGNVLLSDDGAGVRLLEQLRSAVAPDVAEFVDGGTLSFSLLPYIEATESLLVIDAADLGATAG